MAYGEQQSGIPGSRRLPVAGAPGNVYAANQRMHPAAAAAQKQGGRPMIPGMGGKK